MFRKKDTDPIRPAGSADKPAEHGMHSPLEMRSPPPTETAPPRPMLAPLNRDTKAAAPADDAGKRLIVGQGISLSGEITESGRFTNGKAEVEEAEISGVYEGDLTVRKRLLIRSTGQVKGNVRYGEIEVERGGRITGAISMLEPGQS